MSSSGVFPRMTMMESGAIEYDCSVAWSEEDGEFVGTCSRFPSLSCLATTRDEAYQGIVELVRFVIEDMKESPGRSLA